MHDSRTSAKSLKMLPLAAQSHARLAHSAQASPTARNSPLKFDAISPTSLPSACPTCITLSTHGAAIQAHNILRRQADAARARPWCALHARCARKFNDAGHPSFTIDKFFRAPHIRLFAPNKPHSRGLLAFNGLVACHARRSMFPASARAPLGVINSYDRQSALGYIYTLRAEPIFTRASKSARSGDFNKLQYVSQARARSV